MPRFARLVGLMIVGAFLNTPLDAGAQPATPPPATGTGLIVGQVVDAATNRPINGAIVTISSAGPLSISPPGSPPPTRLLVMTGSDGRFVFSDLQNGTFTITAMKGGYLEGGAGRRRPGGPTQPIDLEEGERAGVFTVPMWKHASISGTMVDEAGEPVIGVSVRVMHRMIVGGKRRFAPGPMGTTDDRGMYRIPMLMPGDYIVNVVSTQVAIPAAAMEEYTRAAQTNDPFRNGLMQAFFDAGAVMASAGTPNSVQVGTLLLQTVGRSAVPPPTTADARIFAYPTVFYPGAMSLAQAGTITLASGEERTAVDLQLKPVPMARVSGLVIGPEGPVSHIALRLVSADADAGPTELDVAATLTDTNGTFTLLGVPAGQYLLRVTRTPRPASSVNTMTIIQSGGGMVMSSMSSEGSPTAPVPTDPTLWAVVPIAVGRADISGVAITLRTGLRVSGRVEFEGAREKPAPDVLGRMSVSLDSIDGRTASPMTPPGRVDSSGQFTTYGVPAGKYLLRMPAAPGWTLKSAIYQGRDVSDVPLDLESADAGGVVVTFTDQPTELSGTVQTSRGGDPDATVIVFPSDSTDQSDAVVNPRRTRSVRTAPSGTFKIAGLPAGSYYVAAVPDEYAADWQDPKFLATLARSATRITLDDGDKKTQNVRTTTVR